MTGTANKGDSPEEAAPILSSVHHVIINKLPLILKEEPDPNFNTGLIAGLVSAEVLCLVVLGALVAER